MGQSSDVAIRGQQTQELNTEMPAECSPAFRSQSHRGREDWVGRLHFHTHSCNHATVGQGRRTSPPTSGGVGANCVLAGTDPCVFEHRTAFIPRRKTFEPARSGQRRRSSSFRPASTCPECGRSFRGKTTHRRALAGRFAVPVQGWVFPEEGTRSAIASALRCRIRSSTATTCPHLSVANRH
jgi:hypothetical protein